MSCSTAIARIRHRLLPNLLRLFRRRLLRRRLFSSSAKLSSSSYSSTSGHSHHASKSPHTYLWSLDDQVSPAYTASKSFSTGEFAGMYFMPEGQEAGHRPIVTNIYRSKFTYSLNIPNQMPTSAPDDEGTLPKATKTNSSDHFVRNIVKEASSIFDSKDSWCSRCKAALPVRQKLAKTRPHEVPGVLIKLYKKYRYHRYGKNPDTNMTCVKNHTLQQVKVVSLLKFLLMLIFLRTVLILR